MSRIYNFGYWTTLQKLEKEFGTANFKSKKYILAEQAYADNYGRNEEVRYYAKAFDTDENEYKVTWITTEKWNLANELYQLEQKLNLLPETHEEWTEEEQKRLEELQNMVLVNIEDESNACDWDNPLKIEEI